MLREFVRSYAKNMGFSPEDADYIAANDEDQDLFTLSLNDVTLCTLAPCGNSDDSQALAIVADGSCTEENFADKARSLMRDFELLNRRKCNLIAALTEDGVLGFFAVLPLEGCTQQDFDDFMASLIYFVTARGDKSFVPAYAEFTEETGEIDDFLEAAGLDPVALSDSLDTITFPEGPAVRILKKPALGGLILQSLVKSGATESELRECLAANMPMLGRHFFTFDGSGSIYLNSFIPVSQTAESFLERLGQHAGLNSDFAQAFASQEEKLKEESLVNNVTEFMMV